VERDLLKRHNRIYHASSYDAPQAQSSNIGPDGSVTHRFFRASIEPDGRQISDASSAEITRDHSVSLQDSTPGALTLSHERHASLHDQPLLTTGLLNQQPGQGLSGPTTWNRGLNYSNFSKSYTEDEFSKFIDAIAFPKNPYDPSYQPVPNWASDGSYPTYHNLLDQQGSRPDATESAAEELELQVTSWASRSLSVQPQEQRLELSQTHRRSVPYYVSQVSDRCRDRMTEKLTAYSGIIAPGFKLPSRHTLTNFMTGYFAIFNEHYPMIHVPTLDLETLSLELFLSIASLGAQYYWERTKSLELFHVARDVACERLRGKSAPSHQLRLENQELLELAQALILLISVSTWSEAGKSEAFSLRSLLEEVMNAGVFDLEPSKEADSWNCWKHHEEVKRMKLIAFCIFNLHTITFDVAPMMLHRDLKVGLACSDVLWRADSAEIWQLNLSMERPSISFAAAFQILFEIHGEYPQQIETRSPLSGHALLQAIVQQIWLLQQAGSLPYRHSLTSTEAASSVESALTCWRSTWETGDKSSTGIPRSDGPVPFTSRSLLRLAYIRINIDSGSSRSIGTWDPQKIARSLCQHKPVQRNDRITRAALHCAQALGIPIKLGINFVAHTQVFYWSNQFALCSFECALLLTKWLEAVVVPNPVPALTENERKLLDFVVQLVNHTEYEAPRSQLLHKNKSLSVIILRLWAKLFRPDCVWDIVDLIGRSLRAYADVLEEEDDDAL
jgi:hypothetical protein